MNASFFFFKQIRVDFAHTYHSLLQLQSVGNREQDLKAISLPFQTPSSCMLTHLVEALHHHVRHVLIKHGRWYDDLIEGLVVPPQSWIGWLLLATATAREREFQSRWRAHEHHLPQYTSSPTIQCCVCGRIWTTQSLHLGKHLEKRFILSRDQIAVPPQTETLTRYSRKDTAVLMIVGFHSEEVLLICMLGHFSMLLGPNGTEQFLLSQPVFFLLWKVKMSAVQPVQ